MRGLNDRTDCASVVIAEPKRASEIELDQAANRTYSAIN